MSDVVTFAPIIQVAYGPRFPLAEVEQMVLMKTYGGSACLLLLRQNKYHFFLSGDVESVEAAWEMLEELERMRPTTTIMDDITCEWLLERIPEWIESRRKK